MVLEDTQTINRNPLSITQTNVPRVKDFPLSLRLFTSTMMARRGLDDKSETCSKTMRRNNAGYFL